MLINQRSGEVVARQVAIADTFLTRLRGLIGRAALGPEEALWIRPARQVHTHFMRYAIGVLFLDGEGQVVRLCPRLEPWRVSPYVRAASSVIELAPLAGRLDVRPGDRVILAPGAPQPPA